MIMEDVDKIKIAGHFLLMSGTADVNFMHYVFNLIVLNMS